MTKKNLAIATDATNLAQQPREIVLWYRLVGHKVRWESLQEPGIGAYNFIRVFVCVCPKAAFVQNSGTGTS